MTTLSRSEAEDLLYEEARALDERRYQDWLAMLSADALYWIPCGGEGNDPKREVAIVYDEYPRLCDRIERLMSGMAHAQSPPSKTARLVGNVQVQDLSDGSATVFSSFFLYELRRGRQRVFSGRYEHRLRFDGIRWKIARKKVVLVNNDEVIDNLTFIV